MEKSKGGGGETEKRTGGEGGGACPLVCLKIFWEEAPEPHFVPAGKKHDKRKKVEKR